MANPTGMQGTSGSTSTGRMQGSATGVSDPIYNLISVVYHALQGAETYQKYEQDAQGDQHLAQFFRQACEEEKRRAQQGRELLAQTLQRQGSGQQLQGGSGGQQRGGSGSSQQNQSGSSGQQGGTGSSNQHSQSASSSKQMGSSSSPSSQQSQSGSSQRSDSSQMGSSAQQGSSSQHGSSSSDRNRR
jgi:hypothetical protein